jgi:hypothetical protein
MPTLSAFGEYVDCLIRAYEFQRSKLDHTVEYEDITEKICFLSDYLSDEEVEAVNQISKLLYIIYINRDYNENKYKSECANLGAA